MKAARIILASASPRRSALLNQIGISHNRCPAHIDETRLPSETPQDYVQRMARGKARSLAAPSKPTLGADTVVLSDGQIFGKPRNRDHAAMMMRTLSGKTHAVLTAVSVWNGTRSGEVLATASVTFRHLSDAEVAAYWDSGEPQDKAGGYGIQGLGAIFVQSVTESPGTVAGLPLAETEQLLRQFGISTWQPHSARNRETTSHAGSSGTL